MKPVLLIDFGSTYTKITAVDVDEEKFWVQHKAIPQLKPILSMV